MKPKRLLLSLGLAVLATSSAMMAQQIDGGQPATPTMVGVQDLAWSADGQKLFFSAMRVKPDYSDYTPDKWAVYRYVLPTKRLTRIAASSFSVAASPKKDRIAVGKLIDKNRDVYVLDENGHELARLTTDPADDFGPSWSPDGRRIAFNSKRDGHSEIYVMRSDGADQRRLTSSETDRSLGPSWSPDGRRIAYYLEKGDGKDQIYVMNADGSSALNLTSDSFNNVFPGWISKRRIIYGQGLKGSPTTNVFAVDVTGENKKPLLGLQSFYARYSPDGSKIAYIAFAGAEGARLVIARKDGTELTSVSLEEVGLVR